MPTQTTTRTVASLNTLAILAAARAPTLLPKAERPLRSGFAMRATLLKFSLALGAAWVLTMLSAGWGDVCAQAGSVGCGP